MDPGMEAWIKASTPGEPHQFLAQSAGRWKAKITQWMSPGAPPQVSESTGERSMVMGGRYLIEKVSGSVMGMPFEGMGITGYDNVDKKFHGVWIDNLSTGVMTSEGSCKDGFKSCTFWGAMNDPMAGGPVKVRMEETHIDADHYSFEMYSPGPDGKEFRGMLLEASRIK
jgi:hypothetical protein